VSRIVNPPYQLDIADLITLFEKCSDGAFNDERILITTGVGVSYELFFKGGSRYLPGHDPFAYTPVREVWSVTYQHGTHRTVESGHIGLYRDTAGIYLVYIPNVYGDANSVDGLANQKKLFSSTISLADIEIRF